MKERTMVAALLVGSAVVTGCRGAVLLQEQPAAQELMAGGGSGSSSTAPPTTPCAARVARGSPLPLPGLPPVVWIAADGTYVYVATYEQQNGVVTRISPQDCSTTPLNPYGYYGQFAVDGTNVYSPAVPADIAGGTVIAICPRTGCAGAGSTLATGDVWGIAVADDFLYFTSGASTSSPGVSRVPVSGGPVTALAPDDSAFSLVVAGGNVIYATSSFAVKSVPIDGGAPTNFYSAPDQDGVSSLVADSANVYLAVGDGNIVRVPLAGGAPTTIATGQGAESLAIDAEYLYWGANSIEGTIIRKMALGGGPVVDLGTASLPANGVAVDATYVYFTSGGNVYAIPK
jgi:hypothetical protein